MPCLLLYACSMPRSKPVSKAVTKAAAKGSMASASAREDAELRKSLKAGLVHAGSCWFLLWVGDRLRLNCLRTATLQNMVIFAKVHGPRGCHQMISRVGPLAQ